METTKAIGDVLPAGSRDHAADGSSFDYTGFRVVIYKDILASAVLLSEVAQIGDFVNYDAGIWESTNPRLFNDGYLRVPASRNKNESLEECNISGGWRILEISGSTVQIIHAGTPAQGKWSYSDPNLGKGRREAYLEFNQKCSEFVNTNLATEGRMPLFQDLEKLDLDKHEDLAFVGQHYMVSIYNSSYINKTEYVCVYKSKGETWWGFIYDDDFYFMRPIVTLKAEMLTSTTKTKDEFGHDCWRLIPPQETQGT